MQHSVQGTLPKACIMMQVLMSGHMQAALDMGTVKRSMLEWSLSDICGERTVVGRALPEMPGALSSAAAHGQAFHRLLLAELHAGIKQVCRSQPLQRFQRWTSLRLTLCA